MNHKNIICIISGPTASGKTKISIELAQKFGGEIINFDSVLFYKGLDIGSAKPTLKERRGVPHHLIDIREPDSPINAADFVQLALPLVKELHSQEKIVYLVGGSGFYLQALLYGMFDSSTTSKEIQKKSDDLYKMEGIAPFRECLKKNDTLSYERYHENDHYRIRRAVEHYWMNNTPFSSERDKMMHEREHNAHFITHQWHIHHIHLDMPKELHREIMAKRTQSMLDNGLINEMKELLVAGYTGEEKPLQSIGYKQVADYLKGNLLREDLSERINIATRQLAKAQRTWFKKIKKQVYNPFTQEKELFSDFESFLNTL